MNINPIFLIDFYKVGHIVQYPSNVTKVWSNFTPRSTHVAGATGVRWFGLQYFIKEYLVRQFNINFFNRPWFAIEDEYREVMKATLGVSDPKIDHIKALHDLHYLPIEIFSLPEGVEVPLRVPTLVISNTLPEFFWLPNYLETVLSASLWKATTSATTAKRYRDLFVAAAKRFGYTSAKELEFVQWQGHDFSFRGMSGVEDAIMSGMGHLTSFNGTDTVPAILAAKHYYNADLTCGGSVPATEHSVMCAGGQDGEFETFERLINNIYPTGIVSIVSDTWDLWRVLDNYIPRLRESILNRNGKIVIRPDSGDPVAISIETNKRLANVLGVRDGLINNAGVIYGDSITTNRASAILDGLYELDLSPYNQVFGIGSYTYEYVTRDSYGFAMKATAVEQNGQVVPIFKKPITDSGEKFSLKGIPIVQKVVGEDNVNSFEVFESISAESLNHCAFNKVYSDGVVLWHETFDVIRGRVRN